MRSLFSRLFELLHAILEPREFHDHFCQESGKARVTTGRSNRLHEARL